jgi:hypothetical protein
MIWNVLAMLVHRQIRVAFLDRRGPGAVALVLCGVSG